MGTLSMDLEDQLTEEGVGPGEPRSGEPGRIVLVEGLVHESRAPIF